LDNLPKNHTDRAPLKLIACLIVIYSSNGRAEKPRYFNISYLTSYLVWASADILTLKISHARITSD
jgi:hypothetical protein